jgi:RNA polymerase sigma-70 factor (ECF subfamily)
VSSRGRNSREPTSHNTVVSLSQREITWEIVDACRKGDREAFRALYEAYKDKVYSICLYYFHGDPGAAGDAAQQVFLKLITNIVQFRGDSEFSTWLYRLVVNTCTDGARRSKARKRETGPVELAHVPAPESQEADFAQAQKAKSIQAALSALPPKFRLPILLRYFEDLSYEQTAAALNCSMGTVASRLNRGHKMLARTLEFLR